LADAEILMIWLLLLASLGLAGLVIGTVSLISLQKEEQKPEASQLFVCKRDRREVSQE
jgi:hypothetical protein